jgi:hypothetical protein
MCPAQSRFISTTTSWPKEGKKRNIQGLWEIQTRDSNFRAVKEAKYFDTTSRCNIHLVSIFVRSLIASAHLFYTCQIQYMRLVAFELCRLFRDVD